MTTECKRFELKFHNSNLWSKKALAFIILFKPSRFLCTSHPFVFYQCRWYLKHFTTNSTVVYLQRFFFTTKWFIFTVKSFCLLLKLLYQLWKFFVFMESFVFSNKTVQGQCPSLRSQYYSFLDYFEGKNQIMLFLAPAEKKVIHDFVDETNEYLRDLLIIHKNTLT